MNLAMRGLLKVGDILIPGQGDFPSFSKAKLIGEFPRLLPQMYREDQQGLRWLFSILGLMPSPLVRLVLVLCGHAKFFPSPVAAVLRQVHLGLRGIVFTLYYSGIDRDQILPKLNYQTQINSRLPEDSEMSELLKQANPHEQLTQTQDLAQIMKRAREARVGVRKLSLAERVRYVRNIRLVILRRQEEIIETIQKGTRKARTDILTSEIFPLLEHLVYLENYAEKVLQDETVPTPAAMMGKKSQIWYEPLGVVLVIAPWNYPFYQALAPLSCAFVTGNASVHKPSELTPLKGLVESVLLEAQFAPDWVQIAYGEGQVAQSLIELKPQKIFFTGSVATGKKIMAQASAHLIPVELELGGKDPMLVFASANLMRAVKGAVWGAFTNSGQSCTSVERLYVEREVYEKFKELLIKETQGLRVGVDNDGTADMGEMISPRQVAIVAELVQDALRHGARMLTGQDWDFKSSLIPPILLEGTTHQMRINQEEIFGPVLPLMKFSTEAEAIRLANDSSFGLSASVWGEKETVMRVARQLETGNISINNVMVSEGNHALPFGGVKDSGIGRFKGEAGLRSFTQAKSVLIDGNSKKLEANWYPYTPQRYRLLSQLMGHLFRKNWVGFALSGLQLESYAQKAKREP